MLAANLAASQRDQLTLVQRVIGVWLEEEVLQADHDRGEVEYWLPVLAENVPAVSLGLLRVTHKQTFPSRSRFGW